MNLEVTGMQSARGKKKGMSPRFNVSPRKVFNGAPANYGTLKDVVNLSNGRNRALDEDENEEEQEQVKKSQVCQIY